jgi:hypothetical protein
MGRTAILDYSGHLIYLLKADADISEKQVWLAYEI